MTIEKWKEIPGYEGYYQASNQGKVRSMPRMVKGKGENNSQYKKGGILKPSITSGYYRLTLVKNNQKRYVFVHRLILEAFYHKSNLICNHKNAIKTDNRLSNLEYCTHKQNTNHMYKLGNAKYPKRKVYQYDLDGSFIKGYESRLNAEKTTGIHGGTISSCCREENKKTAGGYYWSYNKREYYKAEHKKLPRKIIFQQRGIVI